MQVTKLSMRPNLNRSTRTRHGKATIAKIQHKIEEIIFWCHQNRDKY